MKRKRARQLEWSAEDSLLLSSAVLVRTCQLTWLTEGLHRSRRWGPREGRGKQISYMVPAHPRAP